MEILLMATIAVGISVVVNLIAYLTGKRLSERKRLTNADKLKRQVGFMNKVLVIIAVYLLVFTQEMVYIHITTGSTPDTLIVSVYAFCGGECGIMGWIKTTKERLREREYEIEDRKGK